MPPPGLIWQIKGTLRVGCCEALHHDSTLQERNAIQQHNQPMQQIHQRIQDRLQMTDGELADNALHGAHLAEQARAMEREMKSYQKQLKRAGKTLALL